jgi:hypothetical protein
MADEASSSRFQSWMNRAQLLLSLITAAGAFYISVQQQRLAEAQAKLSLQVETQQKTSRYAEEMTKYIERMVSAEEKPRLNALMIDLVDAITSAAGSQSGDIERNRLAHMPMWLALSTGNDDGLRLIAGNAERQAIWLPMAMQSSDRKVRETAMEVLRTSRIQPPAEVLKSIFDLSDEFDNLDLEPKALAAMQQVVVRMKRRDDPALERDDRTLRPIVDRLSSIRTSLRGAMAASGLSLEERTKIGMRERTYTALLESIGGNKPTIAAAASIETSPGPSVGVPTSNVNQKALEALESDDAETRRNARVTLAGQLDPATTAVLLKNIKDPKSSYRATLGAVVVFKETSLNVALSGDEEVRAIIALIGDDDATLRANASEFLMKTTDPVMVKKASAELRRVVRDRDEADARPNQVYNAVAVLGTWLRVLPDSLSTERESIEKFVIEEKARMMASGSKWSKTVALIDDLIKLKPSS